ncbi:hypothetical protein B0A48_18264 [Cryoendolithus antarcticus]|uniref:MARVEL domain-containing protein n=1 Tax=Cryoendolithus antarcticus TaxID=1507870 RepID=A0A1V8S8Z2_9PEZI|nr:hypothetical protein B0A48_18264 [Cryoendolithus antarcticus]
MAMRRHPLIPSAGSIAQQQWSPYPVRSVLGLIALIVLAGGIVLQFLTILSGVSTSTPLQHVYFLESTTNGISGGSGMVRNPSRWTFFAICGAENGNNANCGNVVPALPFDPPRNFGTENNVPETFIGTKKFFYLSRFMFAFYLVALFFAVIAFFTSVLAICTRLGAYLTGLNAAIAFFFQTLTAALMTAWTVIGRNNFRAAGQDAHLGTYAFGFTWAAMACFLISTVLFCVGGSVGKDESRNTKSSYFGRKRSTRSRGSFIDNESQRRVKDEYD